MDGPDGRMTLLPMKPVGARLSSRGPAAVSTAQE